MTVGSNPPELSVVSFLRHTCLLETMFREKSRTGVQSAHSDQATMSLAFNQKNKLGLIDRPG